MAESEDHGMRAEYDFQDGAEVTVGKHAAAFRRQARIVRLDDDVAAKFADAEAVNAALRDYLAGKPRSAAG